MPNTVQMSSGLMNGGFQVSLGDEFVIHRRSGRVDGQVHAGQAARGKVVGQLLGRQPGQPGLDFRGPMGSGGIDHVAQAILKDAAHELVNQADQEFGVRHFGSVEESPEETGGPVDGQTAAADEGFVLARTQAQGSLA